MTAPELGSVVYWYVAKYPALTHPPLFLSDFYSIETPYLALYANTARFRSTQDHLPTWVSPIPILAYRSRANSTLGHNLPPNATPAGFLSPPLP